MGKQRFVYDLITRSGIISAAKSDDYHPSYPPENLRNIWTDYGYRTKYGSGSGWGWFYIGGSSRYIDFNYGSVRAAALAAGNYDADSLATEIAAEMTAVGGQTYTCTYSNTTNSFTISAPSNFSLLWSSGANKANSACDTLGFDDTADDTGTKSYTADYLRIHTYAGFDIESWNSGAVTTTACVLLGLNVSESYQIFKLQKWTGAAYEDVDDFTYNDDDGVACVFYTTSGSEKYRILVRDWTNADHYIEFGAVVLGAYQEISRGYEYGASITYDDTSEKMYSKKGYLNVAIGYEQVIEAVQYEIQSADITKVETVWDNVMKRYPFVFIRDADNPSTTMTYAIFRTGIERTQLDELFSKVILTWEKVM
jgi:hypothetical protein